MILKWLEEKTETYCGIFQRGDLLDTKIMGIPDEDAVGLIKGGVVEFMGDSELPPKKWLDRKTRKIVPIEEKPKEKKSEAEKKSY